jgi:nicotinate-nucleotide adenylyltransferase
MTRVGILGGTFNPIHQGHLRAAEEVCEALDLERMILVPSAEPPHKHGSDDDPMAPAEQRLSWVRAAVADNPRLAVDALEVERGGRSYSVDTVREIGARTAPELPVFVIGVDAFIELGTWREPEALLGLAHVAVMTRPPLAPRSLAEVLPSCAKDLIELSADGRSGHHRTAASWIRLLQISLLDISSSDIRARLREGRSVRYLVPEVIREEIASSGVYSGS